MMGYRPELGKRNAQNAATFQASRSPISKKRLVAPSLFMRECSSTPDYRPSIRSTATVGSSHVPCSVPSFKTGGAAMRRPQEDDYVVIFRRYRRTRDGRLLDARKYGLQAWPIRVRKKKLH